MFYVRLFLIAIWFFFACIISFIIYMVLWGNPNATFYCARVWKYLAFPICDIKVELDNESSLYKYQPCVYVSNHQNIFDILLFGALMPRHTVCVFKKELLRIPFFNLFMLAGGHIPISRRRKDEAIAKLDYAVKRIKEDNVSVFIFPEGTRNLTSSLLQPFKKGAFHIALQAQVPIVPFIAEDFREQLNLKKRMIRGGVIRLKVLDAISTNGLNENDVDKLVEKVHSVMLSNLKRFHETKIYG